MAVRVKKHSRNINATKTWKDYKKAVARANKAFEKAKSPIDKARAKAMKPVYAKFRNRGNRKDALTIYFESLEKEEKKYKRKMRPVYDAHKKSKILVTKKYRIYQKARGV